MGGAAQASSRRPRAVDAAGRAAEADRLHRAPRHAQLPRRARSRTLLGQPEAVVSIHGGVRREDRRRDPGGVPQDPDVLGPRRHRRRRRGRQPAAREPDGQLRPAVEPEPDRAALRPHPPHRPDARSATSGTSSPTDTREGEVFAAAVRQDRTATRRLYGDQVYDVLGDSEINRSLQELLVEAIRYGNDPAVRARQGQVIDRDR